MTRATNGRLLARRVAALLQQQQQQQQLRTSTTTTARIGAAAAGWPFAQSRQQQQMLGLRLLGSIAAQRAATRSSSSGLFPAICPPTRSISLAVLQSNDEFEPRHNTTTAAEEAEMVAATGFASLDALIDATVPGAIRRRDGMDLGPAYNAGMSESEFLAHMRDLASRNVVARSYIGMGYHGTRVPPVILRNVLENPGWYTQYTPYQAEIAQGRLEALLAFQTMVCDLTGMAVANASLLDEATAAAEAMTMCSAAARGRKPRFLVSSKCHPQTIAVCQTRAEGLGLRAEVADERDLPAALASASAPSSGGGGVCGVLLQYPDTTGAVADYAALVDAARAAGAKVCVATDLLALTKLAPPGEWGADIVLGSAQRFGVPMGYGGPHAAFLACHDDAKRLLPGRIIGVSVDATGARALRMAMQTREQHIRRDKATSNICTAQALLANMAALYAMYHGPQGLTRIADRVHGLACVLAAGAERLGARPTSDAFFDTITLAVHDADAVVAAAARRGANLRRMDAGHVGVALDETTTLADLDVLFAALADGTKASSSFTAAGLAAELGSTERLQPRLGGRARTSPFLTHALFNSFHGEHDMLRYLKRLENRDLSLAHSMIPLGSCTMKLNATAQMMPITWPELSDLHPFAPREQAAGYQAMFDALAAQLAAITGFDAVSLQPNSGASGEYAGLMAIRAYHRSRGEGHRDVCLIPVSAHGTNPASAVMAGMRIVPVSTDPDGNIDAAELRAKVAQHADRLAALMITYPSTHGVYEAGVDEICAAVHAAGGQVYMDGANMNAQVGLTSPGHIGADVCHLNLHKTFCIPHGGGGPGMGPIGVKAHLARFLPSHPVIATGGLPAGAAAASGAPEPFGTTAAAPYGSALILPISFAYVSMMGSRGLERASRLAILKANYMAARLRGHYDVLYRGPAGTVAHEFILDVRPFEASAGVKAEDIAKRLMDYGFHAPTMSWPVPGTLMVEPTESESKAELDRFVDAMVAIRTEIADVEAGRPHAPRGNNVLTNAPHPAHVVLADAWEKPYSREAAAFPAPWLSGAKFWPTTARVDNAYGDRHLVVRL